MSVEENIRNLQEEIESREGRLKYLSDQVSYSTLDLVLQKEKPFVYHRDAESSFREKMKSSLAEGFNTLTALGLKIISWWPQIIGISIVIIFYS